MIKEEVLGAVLDFYTDGSIPHAITSTFITLIPKSASVSPFADYFINEVFTHILVDRLKPLWQDVILPEQSNYLFGCDISNNILLVQDALQFLNLKK